MLTVWGRPTSSNVQAVMWTVGELGIEHRRIDRGGVFGGTDTPEYRAMNPNGLVPTVRDGDGEPIFESAAIVRYLAARYGPDEFWPKDPAARAQIDKWAEWSKVTYGPVIGSIFGLLVRTPLDQRDSTAVERSVAALQPKLDIAEAQLSRGAFLAGETFTVADVMFGHQLFRYFTLEIERRPLAALARYYDRLQQRPAFREHAMVSYESLRVR